MRLNHSKVQYDREAHTYTLDGVRLRGVTEMIKYQLQPDSYKGISEVVLNKAAMKGSWVHDTCETFDNFGTIPTEKDVEYFKDILWERGDTNAQEQVEYMRNAIVSGNEYKRLKEECGFVYEASEYIVTDGKHFASPIDKVYKVDESTVDIYDIKTISDLDKGAIEKVTWQCSIYAKWFEELNPDIKVRNIGVVWLPDKKYWKKSKKPCMKTLERIPIEEVQKLLDAEVNDEKYRENSVRVSERGKEVVKVEAGIPSQVAAMKEYVIDTLETFKRAEEQKKEMIAKVGDAMAKFNIKSWSTDGFVFSRSADSERRSLDIEKLKEAYPEIDFEQFYKVTNVKGSISVKLK